MKLATAIMMMAIASCMAEGTTNEKLVQGDDDFAGAASQHYGRSLGYAGFQGAGFPYQQNLGYGFDYGNSLYGGYNSGFGAPFLPSQLLSVGYDYPSYASGGYGAAYNPHYGGLNSYGYANQNSFGAYPPYATASIYGAAGSYGSYGSQRLGYGAIRHPGSGYRAGGYGAGARY